LVQAVETPGCRERVATLSGGRKKAAEEAAGRYPGPVEPNKETLGFASTGFLAKPFWRLAFDKYSLAFAPELDSVSLFSPCTMILDDVT
jgi:hypothetical protein